MVPTLTETTGIRGTGNEHMLWNGIVPCTIMVAVVVAEVRMMVRRVFFYPLVYKSTVTKVFANVDVPRHLTNVNLGPDTMSMVGTSYLGSLPDIIM
jgi:hypothetical protein